MSDFVIPGAKLQGPDQQKTAVFIVAEMSANHLQDFGRAKAIVDAAAEAGADAVKLQTYTPDTMTIEANNEHFMVGVNDSWKGKSLYELYQGAYTPWDWHAELKERTEKHGLTFFSTPFDESSVDFLEELEVDLYKIASFELNHIPLLRKVARTRKPVIASRGLASIQDIQLALKTLRADGCNNVALLHCVSSYPAVPEQMKLRVIPDLAKRFDVVTGLSDHTLGTSVPVASVALGAAIVEKHLTLSRADGGPDAAFSLEPAEFGEMVSAIRTVEKALGEVCYEIGEKEAEHRVFRRSIFVVQDIAVGEKFTGENIRIIRPGYGLSPEHFDSLLGKQSVSALKRGTPLSMEHVGD